VLPQADGVGQGRPCRPQRPGPPERRLESRGRAGTWRRGQGSPVFFAGVPNRSQVADAPGIGRIFVRSRAVVDAGSEFDTAICVVGNGSDTRAG